MEEDLRLLPNSWIRQKKSVGEDMCFLQPIGVEHLLKAGDRAVLPQLSEQYRLRSLALSFPARALPPA